MFDSLIKDAVHSGLYSGLQSPITSLAQIADVTLDSLSVDSKLAQTVDILPAPQPKEFGTSGWTAQVIGSGVGMILPFVATKKLLVRGGLKFATEARIASRGTSLLSSGGAALVADGAVAGFATDFLLRPVDSTSDTDLGTQLWNRTKHGTVGAVTFGALTAGSISFRPLTNSMSTLLSDAPRFVKAPATAISNFVEGSLPGIPAGLVSAEANSLSAHGRFATGKERGESIATFMIAGGTFGAFKFFDVNENQAVKNRLQQKESPESKSKYPENKSKTRFPSGEELSNFSPEQFFALFHQNQKTLEHRIETLGRKMPWLAFHGAHSKRSAALFEFFNTGKPHELNYLFLASPTKIAGDVHSHLGDLAGSLGHATGYGGLIPHTNLFVFDVHPNLIKEFYIKETPTSGPKPFAKSKYQGQNDGRMTDKLGTDELRLVTSLSLEDCAYRPELWGGNLPQGKWMEALSYQSLLDKVLTKVGQSQFTPRDWSQHDSRESMIRKFNEMRQEAGLTRRGEDNDFIRNSPGNWSKI